MSDQPNGDGFSPSDLRKLAEALYFREIDHHGEQSVAVHRVRANIEPLLEDLIFSLHDTRAMLPGQQWTVPFGLSCGFEGELIVRVRALGPDHDQEEVPDA